MSVVWSNKGKALKLRHYDISRAHFQGTAQRLLHVRLPAGDGQKYGETQGGKLIKSIPRGKHSAAMFHNAQQDVWTAVRGNDRVCLSDEDGLNHSDSRLKSKNTARDTGTLGFEDSEANCFLLLNRWI